MLLPVRGPQIGKGAHALCYVSECKQYVLKVMKHPEKDYDQVRLATPLVGVLTHIQDEVKILAGLEHPNLIRLSAYDKPNHTLFLQPYCKRGSLSGQLITEKMAKRYMLQILDALEYLHDNYIMHRDIKPANILIDDNDNAILTDMDLATRLLGENDVILRGHVGTPNYASPEVLFTGRYGYVGYSYPADIWSFGVTLYTLLYDVCPFEDTTSYTSYDAIDNTYKNIRKLRYSFPAYPSEVSNDAHDLIRKILVLDPERRLTIQQIREHPFFSGQ